ncbi:unnamed protein product [Clonostachys rhizophaga]|uniref:Zn(2)-C6 fungal-type domain-containing protein n=1 Tax=Clonostachys rhizophaga TaxID=160324 RepID=A0A9N9V392_9HYPO|nr:unnamed protein product [Clonostachys rhizophaga]
MASADSRVGGQGACTTSTDPPLDQPPPLSRSIPTPKQTTSPNSHARSLVPVPFVSANVAPASADAADTTATTAAATTTTTTNSTTNSSTAPANTAAAPGAAGPAPEIEQNGGSKTSEGETEMSGHHQPPGSSPRGPASYPAAPSLSSSSAAVSYPHPPQNHYAPYNHQHSAPPPPSDAAYRASPAPSNSMTLPSMRTIDSMTQSASHSAGPSQSLSAPMPAGSGPMSSFYPVPQSSTLASNYAISPEVVARYAAMPYSPNSVLHRAPKKCDEGHPTCNNCKKSRRDCLGYDPIFRQQTVNLGNSYSPASSSATTVSTPHSQVASPPEHSRILPPPTSRHQGAPHSHIGSNSYGAQPTASLSSYSSASSNGPLPPPTSSSPYHNPNVKSEPGDSKSGIKLDLSPAFHSSSLNGSDHRVLPPPNPGTDGSRSSHQHLRGEKMKINDIINLLGPPPPPQQANSSEEEFNEITRVYHEMYAGSLSAFFETSWYYFVENGQMTFPRDPGLIEGMAAFLKVLQTVKANDHVQMSYSGVLETRVVWQLACTASWAAADNTSNSTRTSLPPDGDAVEAKNRLKVVEALLCGDYLASNPLTPPSQDRDTVRMRQFDFWYQLGEFVRIRELPNAPPAVKARDDVLNKMRHLLDGRENRDVLYSIAVVRELAPQFDPNYASSVPQHLDEADPKNRLAVASKFILDESQVTGGTTNVVRRFSDIAARAFVNPGVNVARAAQ